MKMLSVGVVVLMSTMANADELDGLYRPAASWAANWTCDTNNLGNDGGAVGLFHDILYGVESQCSLGPARPSVDGLGMVYRATCSFEGEVAQTDVQITRTDIGIDITRDGQTLSWQRCDGASTAQTSPTNSRWIAGFAMGISEIWTEDRDGNRIAFTCSGGQDGGINLDLGGRPIAGGTVTFDVDGTKFEMSVRARGGDVITDCNACGDTYLALRNAVARGRVLTVHSVNKTVLFSLSGSGEALDGESCEPAGGGG